MKLISTGGDTPPTDFAQAVLQGLAPDGGLFMPDTLEPLPKERLEGLRGASFSEVAMVLSHHSLSSALPNGDLTSVVESAFDFPMPLVELKDGTLVLELFHGPTLSFKDVGARFMAQLVRRLVPEETALTVLVATSGDTGSAVANAFLGVPGVRTAVLFPKGKVSPLQESQFTTLGGNVLPIAVAGVFDDCQRLVKAAFGDHELRTGLGLTSANSINVARLFPQSFYYVYAWAQLGSHQPPPILSIPSGNFGNLAAGLMAHRMGMPVQRFVAATNTNDVVPDYLESGVYRPRPSVPTVSNAMDVGTPSNMARIDSMYGGNLADLRRDVLGSSHTDPQTRGRIGEAFRSLDYVFDPHTAVGHLGLDYGRAKHPSAPPILLATAHPAKFLDVVEPEIGRAVELPARLAACLEREGHTIEIPPSSDALRETLLAT